MLKAFNRASLPVGLADGLRVELSDGDLGASVPVHPHQDDDGAGDGDQDAEGDQDGLQDEGDHALPLDDGCDGGGKLDAEIGALDVAIWREKEDNGNLLMPVA